MKNRKNRSRKNFNLVKNTMADHVVDIVDDNDKVI